MYPYLKLVQGPQNSLSYFSAISDYCLSQKSLKLNKVIHAQLIKLGFNVYTYLGNRCLDLYSEFGGLSDVLKVFDDISYKNSTSWNICLKGLFRSGHLVRARHLFDEMPVRDVVSWNTMISGYSSHGFGNRAFQIFLEMQNVGTRPSVFTYTIMMSLVSSPCQGKQIHGRLVRSGTDFPNLVLGNSLINMYGNFGLVDYSFGVILTMNKLDIISWNSLMWACHNAGHQELALEQFHRMRSTELLPDQFTSSILISVCSSLQDLEKGKQIFAFCFKVGFVYNSIVSSAAIDLFSKCNRLDDSVQLFRQYQWDSALCSSMISSYARHGLGEEALGLFVLTLRKNLRPTEYMVSCLVSCFSSMFQVELGNQIHSLVLKLGLESDPIVANSLVEMYAKFGCIYGALNIFNEIRVRDLISWNTILTGLTYNGEVSVAMDLFIELIREGIQPDRITLDAVLQACNYGGLVDEGIQILSSMEKEFGVKPGEQHYAFAAELLSRAGRLKETIDIIETMPHRTALIWKSILSSCAVYEDLGFTERVAKKIMEMEPQSSLPYLVLGQAYEMRGKWESMVRVRRAAEHIGAKEFAGCSWIGIKNHLYSFEANELHQHGGKDLYLVLKLLHWEVETEGYAWKMFC